MKTRFLRLSAAVVAAMMAFGLTSCSDDDPDDPSTPSTVTPGGDDQPGGKHETDIDFILLNQGNFGKSDATLAFYGHYDTEPGTTLLRDIEVGGVGNDMIEHDDRLYVALNGSDRVKTFVKDNNDNYAAGDEYTVLQPRYLALDGDYLYVTSYLSSDLDYHGSVVKIDLRKRAIVGQLDLECQPEGIAIVGDKAYIANSADFNAGYYSDVLSVVDLKTFTVVDNMHLVTGVNLNHVAADSRGRIWISTRGNYADIRSCIFRLTLSTGALDKVDVLTDNFTIYEGTVYTYAIDYAANTNLYTSIDANTLTTGSYLDPAVSATIVTPYGIAVEDEDDVDYIYILDANAYGPKGYVHCIKAGASTVTARYEAGPLPCCIIFD